MKNYSLIEKTINPFNNQIKVSGDKSISIRCVLLASQAIGRSKLYNLLESDDVLNSLKSVGKLGINFKKIKNYYEIDGFGLQGFNTEKKVVLNAGNSGTFARLILGLLVDSKNQITIIGDKSLSTRDFLRVTEPLKQFGAVLSSKNKSLPVKILGSNFLRPIKYIENRGSAQCKSSVMLAALKTPGVTKIKAKRSRNHTELLFKTLGIPIKVTSKKVNDTIEIKGISNFNGFNYNVPGDISSSAFFIVLTALANNSKLEIKNVNINPSRTGVLIILKMMGVKILVKNKRIYKGEKIADLTIKSSKKFKPINCPTKLNSAAIDEFLLIFLVAAKANGISYFKNLSELNQKESPRLKWGSKILNKIGIKNILTKDSIKIYGNPSLKINKKIIIKNFLKDHRVFMTSVVASLTFGGVWQIHNKDSINTSFPSFLKKIRLLGARPKYSKFN